MTSLNLSEGDEKEVLEKIDSLKTELAKPSPDENIVKDCLDWLKHKLGNKFFDLLSVLSTQLISYLLKLLGV